MKIYAINLLNAVTLGGSYEGDEVLPSSHDLQCVVGLQHQRVGFSSGRQRSQHTMSLQLASAVGQFPGICVCMCVRVCVTENSTWRKGGRARKRAKSLQAV